MLYQLSYLGKSRRRRRERRFIVRPGSPVHHASPSDSRGAATHGTMAKRARHSPQGDDGPPSQGDANCPKTHEYRSIGVFVVIFAGNDVGIRQPAVQIDIPAAPGTKRKRSLPGRLAADRARLSLAGLLAGFQAGFPGRFPARPGTDWRLSWHSASRSESGSLRHRAARSIHTTASLQHWCRSRPS